MKKKKIGLLATLAISFIALVCASTGILVHNARAQDAAEPVLIGGELEDEYLVGDYLLIPSAQISCDGKTEEAKVVVTKPNGEAVSSTNVALEQGGIYTIEYRAIIDGELKTIEKEIVVLTPTFLGASQNSFGIYGEDMSEHQTGVKGVNVDLAEGDVLYYNDIIDLNESEGRFLEFFFLPQDGAGTIDLRKLVITLTDAHNPSTVLTVILQCHRGSLDEADRWFMNYTYVLAGGQNQLPSGYEGGTKLHVGNDWGTPIYFSYYGMHGDNNVVGNETMKLAYDKELNAVFANDTKIINLDDLNAFSEAWNGFSTGEVRLAISGEGFSRPIAKLMITRIGNNNLNQEILVDDAAPEITVEYNGYDSESLPVASKGYSYPVFDAIAMDKMFGAVPVQTTVYYNYESSQRYQVEIVDGKFKTDRTGFYTIEYLATDGYRNVGKKLITIECKSATPNLSVQAAGEYVTTAQTGDLIFPAEIEYKGGTGKVTTYAVAKTLDGQEYPMDNGFRPERGGEYYVVLYAEDMLGKTATYVYELTVEANVHPVFLDEALLPRYFVAGFSYAIPALGAYDYADGKAQISTTISVIDGDGERELKGGVGTFTPDANGYATIIYTAEGALGTSTKEYKVPVANPWEDEETLNLSYYFQSEDNIVRELHDDCVTITSTTDVEYDFVTPVIADNFDLRFAIRENEFECIQLVFTDSVDPSIQFTVEIDKSSIESESALLRINGVATRYRPSANFYNGENFYFSYDDVNVYLCDDAILKQPIKNADGSLFEGFPSKKLYATVRIIGVSGTAELAWMSFAGQILDNTEEDAIKPTITIVNDYKASYAYKEVCEIYSAIAADVLSPETIDSLTVYDPNGDIVRDINGVLLDEVPFDTSYFINLNYYGSYSIMYTSEDISGRKQTYYYAIYVTDSVAPKVVLEGEMQTEVQFGRDINVVKAVAVDNLDGEVALYTYIVDPEGLVKKVENGGTFTATKAGVYEVRYMAIDSFGNLQIVSYFVTVIGGASGGMEGLPIDNTLLILIIGGAALVLIILALIMIPRAKRAKAKKKALKKFNETYVDVKMDVEAVVYGTTEQQDKSITQLNCIADCMLNATVTIPEGGKLTKNVDIKREEQGGKQ